MGTEKYVLYYEAAGHFSSDSFCSTVAGGRPFIARPARQIVRLLSASDELCLRTASDEFEQDSRVELGRLAIFTFS